MKTEDVSLPDICELVTDGTHATPKLQDSGIPFIKGKHISGGGIDFDSCDYISYEDHRECVKRVRPQKYDVLFANIGSVGDVAQVEDDREFSIKNVALFRPNRDKIDPNYFYYLVKSPYFRGRFVGQRSGSAQPFISLKNLRTQKFPYIPDRELQQRIGNSLSNYDDLIANNQRRIELLERAAQLIYKEWFVNLRFPGHEDVEIHDGVPEGWTKERLEDIADIVMGQSPKSEHYNYKGEGWPFHQGVNNFGTRYPDHEVYCDQEKRVAEHGDILLSVRAPVGRMNISPEKIVIGRGLAAIRSKYDSQSLLYYQLGEIFFKENIMGTGAIFESVRKKDLQNLELLRPPRNIVEAFQEQVVPIDKQIETLHKMNKRLTEARDLLLPRLMNGEIEV